MIIFHGDNLVVSRQRLTQETKQFSGEVIRLNGRQANLDQFQQALEASSLFDQKKLVIVEDLFSRPAGQEKDKILTYLKQPTTANLILWEGKTIDGRRLAGFKNAQVEKYLLPATIFKFLDSLGQNKKVSLYWLRQTLINEPAELVFFLLCRRVGDLIIAADLGASGLDKMAPWQKSRLVQQTKNFPLKRLVAVYGKLLEIDWQQKTGQAAYNLPATLDLLVASL